MFLVKAIYNLVFGGQPTESIENTVPAIDLESLIKATEVQNLRLEDEKRENENICEHRVGKVMFINGNEVIIDEGLIYDASNAPHLNLAEGSRVAYVAYRREAHHEWRVQKVLYVVEEDWDNQEENKEQDEQTSSTKTDIVTAGPPAVPKDVLKRRYVGQVKDRQGRKLILEPENLICDLDTVKCQFVPHIGDWIELDCAAEVDEKVFDLTGDVLDIEEVRALRSRIHVGIIIKWNGHSGTINSDTYFNKDNLEPGYCPTVGNKVIVESIESERGHLNWRAISVVQYGTGTKSTKNKKEQELSEELKILFQNKKGIVISEVLDFGLINLGEEKGIVTKIKNEGHWTQTLLHGKFHSKRSESQFRCTYPSGNRAIVIAPGETVEYHFTCKGRFSGKVSELFVFAFRGFRIGRYIGVEVQHPSQAYLLPIKEYCGQSDALPQSYHHIKGNYITGERPMRSPSFVPVRIPLYNVPNKVFDVLTFECKTRFHEVLHELKEIDPSLASELNISNYQRKFHSLLHIEEVQYVCNMRQYDMNNVQFIVAGPSREFLAVEIPGLSERKPSLLPNCRAIAVSSAAVDKELSNPPVYEGFIHKVFQTEVWLKFHSSLHFNYKGEEFNISFQFSRTSVRKCHAAVDLAVKHLGDKMLFPVIIKKQAPQLLIDDDKSVFSLSKNSSGSEETAQRLDESGQNCGTDNKVLQFLNNVSNNDIAQTVGPLSQEIPELAKRKIKWLNPDLNSYQKDAVLNVLEGEARPLPYVIFGPPGTGKTVTLVEAILQTLILIPQSRILVATPSNSSADLLAERLLDSNILIPGDLVRLVALYYWNKHNFSEKLLPYCTTADIKLRHNEPCSTSFLETPLKQSSSAKVLGRHRITVGTCVTLGQLYSMGYARDHFTHVFIDEAGQATEPETMIPLAFLNPESGQVVLAGDPLQLGPVILSSYASNLGLGESYLSRLMQLCPYQRDVQGFPDTGGYNPFVITQLRINYRSVPEILDLANNIFYNSNIKPYVSQSEGPEADLLKRLAPDLPERSLEDGGPPAVIFHGIRGQNFQEEGSPSWFNPQEIVEALNYANMLYDAELTPDDIGIITPYQKQVKKLRIFLEEFEIPVPKIGSVEEFQGQERKVIILSTVRSALTVDKVNREHSLGFVSSPKRLNVSLTRARALLIILGNPHLLIRDPLWKRVLKYCVDHKAYKGCDLPYDDDVCSLSEIQNDDES